MSVSPNGAITQYVCHRSLNLAFSAALKRRKRSHLPRMFGEIVCRHSGTRRAYFLKLARSRCTLRPCIRFREQCIQHSGLQEPPRTEKNPASFLASLGNSCLVQNPDMARYTGPLAENLHKFTYRQLESSYENFYSQTVGSAIHALCSKFCPCQKDIRILYILSIGSNFAAFLYRFGRWAPKPSHLAALPQKPDCHAYSEQLETFDPQAVLCAMQSACPI